MLLPSGDHLGDRSVSSAREIGDRSVSSAREIGVNLWAKNPAGGGWLSSAATPRHRTNPAAMSATPGSGRRFLAAETAGIALAESDSESRSRNWRSSR